MQAALAESNLNFLHRNHSDASPLGADRGYHNDESQQSPVKRVKLEEPDDLSESKATPTDYYGGGGGGGDSIGGGVGGGKHSADDGDDASSTENYEPLNCKGWHQQQRLDAAAAAAAATAAANDQDFTSMARGCGASLTVEVGAVSHHSPAAVRDTDYLTSSTPIHGAK